MSIKDRFKLECQCGSRCFHLIRRPSSNSRLYFICEDCQNTIGSVDGYSVSWVREGSDYDED